MGFFYLIDDGSQIIDMVDKGVGSTICQIYGEEIGGTFCVGATVKQSSVLPWHVLGFLRQPNLPS